MTDELYAFIKELIDEIDNLQQTVDGEYSTDFERSSLSRQEDKQALLDELEKFRIAGMSKN